MWTLCTAARQRSRFDIGDFPAFFDKCDRSRSQQPTNQDVLDKSHRTASLRSALKTINRFEQTVIDQTVYVPLQNDRQMRRGDIARLDILVLRQVDAS